jgi:hypothetical protein
MSKQISELLDELIGLGKDCKRGGWKRNQILWCSESHKITVGALLDLQQILKLFEWRPIETVPKDSREVLLKVKECAGVPDGCLVGHYMEGGHCIEDHPPIAEGWYFWNGCYFDKASEPVEWCPLPE